MQQRLDLFNVVLISNPKKIIENIKYIIDLNSFKSDRSEVIMQKR